MNSNMQSKAAMGQSVFTGAMPGLRGDNLQTGLVTGIPFGIAYPWMVCFKKSWMTAAPVSRLRSQQPGLRRMAYV